MNEDHYDKHRQSRLSSYRDAAASDDSGVDSYKGLRIHAFPGLHAHIARMAGKYIPDGSTALDIAAGSGALSLRLHDSGYRVTACDAVSENFRLHDRVRFVNVDLDEQFSRSFDAGFDSIFAIEILEHLENPRQFLRQCMELLVPGGYIFLSTPNIDNPVSIANFARSGKFRLFEDRQYRKDGHITPISVWQIQKIAEELGARELMISSYGDPFREIQGSPRMLLLARILSWLSQRPPEMSGEILCVGFRKPPVQ